MCRELIMFIHRRNRILLYNKCKGAIYNSSGQDPCGVDMAVNRTDMCTVCM